MSLDFTTRKFYYNRCNPNESLSPTDDRNLDIDAYGAESVRGINWVERLASRIELSNIPAFELFTGLPGSGKSTELRRLTARLEHKDNAPLLTVLVDAEEVILIQASSAAMCSGMVARPKIHPPRRRPG